MMTSLNLVAAGAGITVVPASMQVFTRMQSSTGRSRKECVWTLR